MCSALSKMVQVRNVPDELHRMLEVRAAAAGMTLSDYLLRELRDIAEKPTLEELFRSIHHDAPVTLDPATVAEDIRRARDERADQVLAAAERTRESPD
jgi:plasmid stability protein